MKNNQLEKKNYIPLLIIFISCIFMLLIFLIPYSRYSLLSNLDSSRNGSLAYYLSFVCSIGEIAIFGILIALCVLELFTSKLFAFRLELTCDLIFLFLAYILEIIYIISFSFLSSSFSGIPYFIPLSCFSILFILSLISSIYFVYIPFKKIERNAVKIEEKWNQIEEENKKRKEIAYKDEISNINSKEGMREYLKKKYQNGELSKEKYLEFLIDLDSKEEKKEL